MKKNATIFNVKQTLLIALFLLGFQGVFAQAPTPQYAYTNATGGNWIPFGVANGWDNYRSQFLYLPGDFPTLTSTNPGFITDIYFKSYYATSNFTMNNFQVDMGNTTVTNLSGYVSGLTNALPPTTWSAGTSINAGDWFVIHLATPVYMNPSQPFVVDVRQTGGTGGVPVYAGGVPNNSQYTGNTHAYGSTTSSTASVRRYSYQFGFDFFSGYPCNDTPRSSVDGPIRVCPNKRFTVRPDSFYATAEYKWQYSTNGTTWSNFTGTPGLYGEIYDSITQAKWYRVTITCDSNKGLTYTSPGHKVSIAPFYYCYCDNSVTSDLGADIGKVAIINVTNDDSIMNKSFLITGTGYPVYNNSQANKTYTPYHDSLAWPCLYRDSSYRLVVTQIHPGSTLQPSVAQVYIDYNRDGLYNPNTERVFIKAIDGTANPPEVAIAPLVVPTTAETGLTGMRVIISQDTVQGAPCDTISGYGEVEDYVVEICYRPCTGPVNGGVVVSTDTSMCKGYEYTLTDTTYEKTVSGFTRAWQVSGDNITWFNIQNSEGKDTLNRVFTGQPLYYRLRTICLPTHDTAYNAPTQIKVKPGYKCYCYSKAIGGEGIDTSDIGGVTFGPYSRNNGGPHLLNPIARYPRTDYTDITPIEMFTDTVYQFAVYHTMPVVEHGDAKVTIFMDFNNNHEYDIPSERVYTGYTSIGNHTLIDNVIVPLNAILDVPTGMRIILNNNVGPNAPSDSACGGYMSGETEDYILIFRKRIPEGVSEVGALNGFSVHPNPTSGKFNVQFSTNVNISNVNLRITNVTGQLVMQQDYKHEGGMFYKEVDMGKQAPGVYFVELQADGQRLMRKLVVQ
ncbi:MAG: T9SS type A sorting domain-containing protein [Chitinophagales bacterium]|nr:T9SS type A sorting domain-containing protein [Chitinophagales bacterium]